MNFHPTLSLSQLLIIGFLRFWFRMALYFFVFFRKLRAGSLPAIAEAYSYVTWRHRMKTGNFSHGKHVRTGHFTGNFLPWWLPVLSGYPVKSIGGWSFYHEILGKPCKVLEQDQDQVWKQHFSFCLFIHQCRAGCLCTGLPRVWLFSFSDKNCKGSQLKGELVVGSPWILDALSTEHQSTEHQYCREFGERKICWSTGWTFS